LFSLVLIKIKIIKYKMTVSTLLLSLIQIILIRIISRTIFTQIKHRLTIGIIFLIQTLITRLIRGSIQKYSDFNTFYSLYS
jgi:hypothetical protein